MLKNTQSVKECANCNECIIGDTSKVNQYYDLGVKRNRIDLAMYRCPHILCPDCIAKTTTRYQNERGMCEQCLWWDIT